MKVRLVSDFLKRLDPNEVEPAVHLIIGSIFPSSESKALNVGWATMTMVGKDQSKLFVQPLTIRKVAGYFDSIASVKGKDSKKAKVELLTAMLSEASEDEAKWILKNIQGEMQHGVNEGVMVEAIAEASAVQPGLVRMADMLSGNLGEIARVALQRGREGLEKYGIELFRPVKPMLAEMGASVEDALKEHGGTSAFEVKLDGARIQIHKDGQVVKVFSRRLSDVTGSLPDVVSTIKDSVRAESAILEGEVVAIGDGGKPMVFQDLMRRFGRIRQVEKAIAEIPLRVVLFDILYLDGRNLTNMEYEGRWRLLEKVCDRSLLVQRLVTSDASEAESFLHSAMQAGHEGLMAKDLRSDYEVGKRGKKWLKIKPSEKLDLVITAADWGYGRRSGWLSNYHLAARDEVTGEFLVIGKTFKGLTDEEFVQMTDRLRSAELSQNGYTVRVRPEIVVEVAFNEIQRSPHYRSGFALRFARITRIREDKGPQDVDTLQRVRSLYEKQFKYKSRAERRETV
ncbi:MAG: ATP-dependent DNA ligase [Candidatus Brockarchaeota archaeon]|nr:ATP-dependent DNA ligase [Candidatus Brockarchaeota archaeon]